MELVAHRRPHDGSDRLLGKRGDEPGAVETLIEGSRQFRSTFLRPQAVSLLREHGVEPEIVEYLVTPPTEAELTHALAELGMRPRDLMRKKEAVYAELGLADESLSEAALVEAMASHPILIERPLVFVDERAAVGRPPENVLSLLD